MTIKSKLRRTYRPPETTLYAWDISHALATTYHLYCQSPGALTEYLKDKLCHQRAKRLSHSLPAQVKPNVLLRRNTLIKHTQPRECPSLPHLVLDLDPPAMWKSSRPSDCCRSALCPSIQSNLLKPQVSLLVTTLSTYQRLTHKPQASYGHALGLLDWQLVIRMTVWEPWSNLGASLTVSGLCSSITRTQ